MNEWNKPLTFFVDVGFDEIFKKNSSFINIFTHFLRKSRLKHQN
jgi:hypothetical protein